MNATLHQEILKCLAKFPILQNEEGRKAVLIQAGLDALLPQIDLHGATTVYLNLLIKSLDHYGRLPNGQPALNALFQVLATMTGQEGQQQLQALSEHVQQGQQAQQDQQAQQARQDEQMSNEDRRQSNQVFISYAREDWQHAKRLYDDLKQTGATPWMDTEDLRAGQQWKTLINQAIRKSAYVLTLLSPHSLSKRGYVQKELKKALDIVDELPPEGIFVIPVRLTECEPLDERLQELHWVNLFLDYDAGLQRILQAMNIPKQKQLEQHKPEQHKPEQHKPEQAHPKQARPKQTRPKQTRPTPGQRHWKILLVFLLPVLLIGIVMLTDPGIIRRWIAPDPTPSYSFRSEPLAISQEDAQQVFNLITQKFKIGETEYTAWRPIQYTDNRYEDDRGNVVFDRATGLMWQKSGSDWLTYEQAQKYIEELNRQTFAGHDNWRLPTIPELMSLLEPEKSSNGLYINSIFDKTQRYCWSADKRLTEGGSPSAAWDVTFNDGRVYLNPPGNRYYVRAVRS